MKKILILILSLFVCFHSYSQKKKPKSIQQQADEYIIRFDKLSPIEKRQASANLVNSLNRMDSNSRALWLSALLIAESKIKKKPQEDPVMSDANIEKGIIKITKANMQAYYFDPMQDSLVSIKIIEKMSNKDWALRTNTILQNKIDTTKTYLASLKQERLDLKKKIPENYNYKNDPTDSLYDYRTRIEYLEQEIPDITNKLIHYPELLLKGISNDLDKINWEDEKPSSFLVEVISYPNDGLDNLKETHYFIGNYVKGRNFSISVDDDSGIMSSQDLNIDFIESIYEEGETIKISSRTDALKAFYKKYSYLENLHRYENY